MHVCGAVRFRERDVGHLAIDGKCVPLRGAVAAVEHVSSKRSPGCSIELLDEYAALTGAHDLKERKRRTITGERKAWTFGGQGRIVVRDPSNEGPPRTVPRAHVDALMAVAELVE